MRLATLVRNCSFCGVLTLAFGAIAETGPTDPSRADLSQLKQDGHFVSVRLEMGKPLKIFVVGREEAHLDLSKLELSVWRLNPTVTGKALNVQRKGPYFFISDKLEDGSGLKITTKVQDKAETFYFNVKDQGALK